MHQLALPAFRKTTARASRKPKNALRSDASPDWASSARNKVAAASRPSVNAVGRSHAFLLREAPSPHGREIEQTNTKPANPVATGAPTSQDEAVAVIRCASFSTKHATSRQANQEQAQGPKNAHMELPVEPAASEEPQEVGKTMVQPRTPIMARFGRWSVPPSRCHRSRRSCRVYGVAQSLVFVGSCVIARGFQGN